MNLHPGSGTSFPQMTKGRVVVNRYFAGWGKAGLEGSSADPTLRKTPDFLSIMATSKNSMRLSSESRTHGPSWCSEVENPGQSEGWGTRRFVTQ
jgi:hypothetical protein